MTPNLLLYNHLGRHSGLGSVLGLEGLERLGGHELVGRLALLAALDGLDQLGQRAVLQRSNHMRPKGDRLDGRIGSLQILEGERTLGRNRDGDSGTARLGLDSGASVEVDGDISVSSVHMFFIYYSYSLPPFFPESTAFFNFLLNLSLSGWHPQLI